MHVHPHTDEGFYIGQGEMTFVFPDREVVAGAGAYVFVPLASSTQRTSIYSPGDAEHITQPVQTP